MAQLGDRQDLVEEPGVDAGGCENLLDGRAPTQRELDGVQPTVVRTGRLHQLLGDRPGPCAQFHDALRPRPVDPPDHRLGEEPRGRKAYRAFPAQLARVRTIDAEKRYFRADKVHTRFIDEHAKALIEAASRLQPGLYFQSATAAPNARQAGARIDAVDPLAVLAFGKSAQPPVAEAPQEVPEGTVVRMRVP